MALGVSCRHRTRCVELVEQLQHCGRFPEAIATQVGADWTEDAGRLESRDRRIGGWVADVQHPFHPARRDHGGPGEEREEAL